MVNTTKLIGDLLLAVEGVDNAWHDEGDHIEWDETVLSERLIALRNAYNIYNKEIILSFYPYILTTGTTY